MLGSLVLQIDDLGTMMPMKCFSRDPSAPLLASRSLRKQDLHGSQGYYPDRGRSCISSWLGSEATACLALMHHVQRSQMWNQVTRQQHDQNPDHGSSRNHCRSGVLKLPAKDNPIGKGSIPEDSILSSDSSNTRDRSVSGYRLSPWEV